jgi:CRP/FNR family transcriptional regulator, cyclic AMP receptor protein
MTAGDIVGYIAAFFVLVTFWMKTMIPLRVAGLASNVLFIAYGYMAAAYPPLFLHILLLPLNAHRLYQMRQLNIRVAEAVHSDMNMAWIKPYAHSRIIEAGTLMFRKGDAATAMYAIVSGRYLLEETGIVLAAGDAVGELGLLSPGRTRTQSLRCTESGEMLEISYDEVRQLYFQNPQFGFFFLQLSTQRLFAEIGRLEGELAAARAGR